jgi:hypothetical protein
MFHLRRNLNAMLLSAVVTAGLNSLNYSNPTIGATRVNFVIDTNASAISKLSCATTGSRCGFRRGNYASVDFGKGQETEDAQGAVWAATDVTAVLTLGGCTANDTANNCIVTCNANCTCAYTTTGSNAATAVPTSCTDVSSRAPTMVPQTAAPVPSVCPKIQFTQFCPDLVRNALPPGIDKMYDCYNFCGGSWISTCDYSGSCGQTDCGNKTAAGTATGQVFGCTLADKTRGSTKSGGTSGSAWTALTSTSTTLAIMGYAAALGVILQAIGMC